MAPLLSLVAPFTAADPCPDLLFSWTRLWLGRTCRVLVPNLSNHPRHSKNPIVALTNAVKSNLRFRLPLSTPGGP
ncbi:hypothetical protein B0T25DRAFT_37372 [Lasiosphaeria hispida]|uniref:Uncharacterized protein n=1 Tax=Lasiosphaeria hispida TaxID=260671 RepID=A0AAJ0HUW2_9PEZI|nr:hypothetical protein B0T25DRAFT_37372 [Lasiosphaeria hispida]